MLNHCSSPRQIFGRGLNTIVLVSGAVSNLDVFAEYGLPTDGSADVAELLLDLYLDGFHAKDGHADQPARLLSQLKGNFSFILYDASVQVRDVLTACLSLAWPYRPMLLAPTDCVGGLNPN